MKLSYFYNKFRMLEKEAFSQINFKFTQVNTFLGTFINDDPYYELL